MRLALDAMGGDNAPAAAVEGAVLYARKAPSDTVILVGDEPRLAAELARLKARGAVQVVHAPDVVGLDEHPATAVRRKKSSSLRVAFDLVAQHAADAVVSVGSTGAALAAGLLVLGRLPGVERPAVIIMLPKMKGGFAALLDSGANVTCRPSHLSLFAHLGEVWARRALSIDRPRVALLSNGSERARGTDLTRAALGLLERSALNFIGYVEGNDLFADAADVIVTDGFTGNVVLKTTEGAAWALGATLKREVEAHSTARVGAWLARPAFVAFRKITDWAEYGGAPLLGVDGVAIIGHGRSGPRAFRNALRAASHAASLQLGPELSQAATAASALCKLSAREE